MANIGSPKMQCPHCGAIASCVRTDNFSPITRGKVYRCADTECGFTFRSHESISETIVMSSKPNPDVKIPFSLKLIDSLLLQASNLQSKQG